MVLKKYVWWVGGALAEWYMPQPLRSLWQQPGGEKINETQNIPGSTPAPVQANLEKNVFFVFT